MSRNLTALALVAGLGLSMVHQALADAQNLSCISDESVHARKVVRDCEMNSPAPYYVLIEKAVDDPNDPNNPPMPIKHGEGRDHGGHGHGSDSDGGGEPGGPN